MKCPAKIMGDLLACRVCLVTDKELVNIHEIKLEIDLKRVLNVKFQHMDGMPQHICSQCQCLLATYGSFKRTCEAAQNILRSAASKGIPLTTEYFRQLNRTSHKLDPSYTKQPVTVEVNHEMSIKDETVRVKPEKRESEEPSFLILKEIKVEEQDSNQQIKLYPGQFVDELDCDTGFQDLSDARSSCSSDDEPLSMKASKRKKVKKTSKECVKSKKSDLKVAKKSVDDFLKEHHVEFKKLTKKEQIAEVEARKTSLNYLGSIYKCDKCFKGFWKERTFRNHMSWHDPAMGDHVCDVCQMRYENVMKLNLHRVRVHQEKYTCTVCGYVSNCRNRARDHHKWHQGFSYECKKCQKSFGKQSSYLTHLRMSHRSENVCDICGESFIGVHGLRIHKYKTHRTVPNDTSYCKGCQQSFDDESALRIHLGTSSCHTKDALRYCKSCDVCGPADKELQGHWRNHKDCKGGQVECSECQKQCKNRRTYMLHFRKVHLGAMMKGANSGLNGAKSYICDVCGRKCATKASFIAHQRGHTGEKPFPCPLCPKTFRVHTLMQIHLRVHTGERPNKCEVCPKEFRTKAALNRHTRVHTGIKPYSCSHCGKSFSQSNSMKVHITTVHLRLPAPYRSKRRKDKPSSES